MKRTEIDINSDLGEGAGQDEAIMPLISSCNIACGGHFGTDETMRTTISLARKHKVKIGAHPSFPDSDNFGRKVLTLTKSELSQAIYFQLLHFYAVCETENVPVHHIKLHGALYNYAARDAATSDAVVEAIIATGVRPVLYLPYGSVLHKKAEHLLPLKFEAFVDRRYNDDGSLVSRGQANAIIDSPEESWEQLFRLIKEQEVISVKGNSVPITSSTFCIHGDHPNAVGIAGYIFEQLIKNKIRIK